MDGEASDAQVRALMALARAQVTKSAPAKPFVMIIRHAEKPEGSDYGLGVKKHGKHDEHSLTVRGWTRAGALVGLFAPSDGSPRTGLVTPTAIYASGGDNGEGRRTRQTIHPLAKRLGLDVDSNFARCDGQEPDLAEEVGNRPGPTLICWQHEDIPKLANAFGKLTPAPPEKWPDERFDVVWTLTPNDDGDGWLFSQVPQLLLDGDRDEPCSAKTVEVELVKAVSSVDLALLARLTAWFASKDAIKATQLPDELIDAMAAAGLDRQVAIKVGSMVMGIPLSGRSRHGAPDHFPGMTNARRVAGEEPQMRARYVLAAARRLTQALADKRYDAASAAEQRYLEEHVAAGRNRRRAAVRLDDLGKRSETLRWVAVLDDRTTPECAALDGRLFSADNPPGIPGAMHPRCRCSAEPWGRGPLVQWGAHAS